MLACFPRFRAFVDRLAALPARIGSVSLDRLRNTTLAVDRDVAPPLDLARRLRQDPRGTLAAMWVLESGCAADPDNAAVRGTLGNPRAASPASQ